VLVRCGQAGCDKVQCCEVAGGHNPGTIALSEDAIQIADTALHLRNYPALPPATLDQNADGLRTYFDDDALGANHTNGPRLLACSHGLCEIQEQLLRTAIIPRTTDEAGSVWLLTTL